MTCELCVTIGCPQWVLNLAAIGILALYFLIAGLMFLILRDKKSFCRLSMGSGGAGLMAAAWPITLMMAGVYIMAMWIIFPFIGATKGDLKKLENKLTTPEIDVSDEPETDEDSDKEALPFKAGDIITGVPGNPGGYKHLYEGCKAKVLSIDEKGSMELILIGHEDAEAQAKYIGDTYTAPARNFVLYKEKSKSKAKSSKKKKM